MAVDPMIIKIMSQVFNADINKLTDETTKDDIEEWDSLEHIKLILEIESQFNVKFSLDIIPELVTVKRIDEEVKKLKS